MNKIDDQTKTKVLELRSQGLSYAQIVKAVDISRTSVINIIKNGTRELSDEQALSESTGGRTDLPIEAKVKKSCPNPRLIIIYFNDNVEDDAICVVRPGMNYPRGKTLLVKKVETSEEPLYRIV